MADDEIQEDSGVEVADENLPDHADDGKIQSFADIRRNFFGSEAADAPGMDEIGQDEPDAIETLSAGEDPARARLQNIGKKASAEDPPVTDLIEGEEEEGVEGDGKAASKGRPEGVEAAAATTAQEFRTPDGYRYRLVGADGKPRDVLAELKGTSLEVFADGEFRKIPIEKLPVVVNNAVLFNKQQGALAQAKQSLSEREQAIVDREAEVERFFSDPEYRARVERELEEAASPEGQLKIKDQQVQEARNEVAIRDMQEAQVLVNDNIVSPVLNAIAEHHPLVSTAVIESFYSAAMMEFQPGDLKLVKGRDDQFKPVNPRHWQRLSHILQHDLPAKVAAEQQRLAGLGVKQGQNPKDDVASRKTKAAAGAKVVREELRVNRTAQRLPHSAGLRPNRDKPRPAITTIQQGRKWLNGD